MIINISFTVNYLHLQGNRDISFWLNQLIKCGLIASCINCSLLGFLPNANAVAVAIANKQRFDFVKLAFQSCVETN